MNQPRKRDILVRYAVAGLVTGLLIPFFSFLLAALTDGTGLTVRGLLALHRNHPVQYLLDLLPLAAAVAGYFHALSVYRTRYMIWKTSEESEHRSRMIYEFISKLISNDLDAEYIPEGAHDVLGASLVSLRDNLRSSREEQVRRKQEDGQKNWVSEGLAKFSEIMRIHAGNMEEFAFSIISELVRYLDANQGGFYLAEQEEGSGAYFDMKACYAYDRKKFSDKRVGWDEGLIGTCAMERQSIYITDIPEDYLNITSGLGHANPRVLLIVPLAVRQEVLGIIELASFHEIPAYRIRFVENLAESIAMTLNGLKSNIRTSELLKESRIQAETLALQEEKMRRNMEELKSTQEKAASQAEKFISFTNSVNHTLIRAEYDVNGTLTYANTKFLRMLGYFSNTEVEGKHISMFIDVKDREWFNKIWDRLAAGGKHYEGYMKHMTRQGQDLWTMATYTCVRRDDGSVEKILFLAIETTEQKKQSLDYEGQIEAINRLNIKAEFAPDGKFLSCNELFEETLKYTGKEMEKMSVFDLFDKRDIERFNEIWEDVNKGKAFQGQLKNLDKYEDERWFRATYSAVHDMYGEVAKVIYIASEITNERLMEIETRKQTDRLKIQEEKLKLSGMELKKKIGQSKAELEKRYSGMERERDRLLQVIDRHPDLVVTIDPAAGLIYMNAAAEKFWKCSSKDMSGKPPVSLFPGKSEDYAPLLRNFIDAGKNGLRSGRAKVRLKDASGKWIGADMSVTVTGSEGEKAFTAVFGIGKKE